MDFIEYGPKLSYYCAICRVITLYDMLLFEKNSLNSLLTWNSLYRKVSEKFFSNCWHYVLAHFFVNVPRPVDSEGTFCVCVFYPAPSEGREPSISKQKEKRHPLRGTKP